MTEQPQRLYRSRTDRMVAGVAGGLAEYFGLDPTVVRLVYLVVTVLTGFFPGLLLYLAMVLIVPTGSSAEGVEPGQTANRPALAGLLLLTVGVLILLGNFGVFSFWSWARWWPLLLVLLGAALLLRRRA